MPSLAELFTTHPRQQGESYLGHAVVAASVGGRMIAGGAACMVHAALPFLFTTTGSRTIRDLSARLRTRHAPSSPRLARAGERAFADFGMGI